MMRPACLVVIFVVAGCGDNLSGDANSPADAGSDGPVDAPVDVHVDTPPSSLTELCGTEPPATSDVNYIDYWESCYKRRWCEVQVGCVPQSSFRDVQECLDRSDEVEGSRLVAELRERRRAVDHARASLDVAAFTQCLIDTSGDRCTTVQSSVACATRFTGTIADGGGCYADIECASPGATCESSCSDACCLGTCRPKFREGEMCDLFESCEPGLVCHRTCLSGDIDAPCGSNRDCDSNAWCNAGRCSADLAPGAACTSPLQCGGRSSCIGLSIVDSSPGHCLSISRAGDRCDYFCYGNLYCDGSGTCRDLPGLDQSCSGLAPCGGVDNICSNGRCVQRGGVDASCTSSRTCMPGLFCTSELNDPKPTCALPGAVDQPCVAPSHCESYLCSGTSGQPGVCLTWSDSCPLGGVRPENIQ